MKFMFGRQYDVMCSLHELIERNSGVIGRRERVRHMHNKWIQLAFDYLFDHYNRNSRLIKASDQIKSDDDWGYYKITQKDKRMG